VVTIPDLIAFRYPEHVGRAKRVYWGIGLPLAIDRASAVIAISEFTRSEVCDLFPGACGKVHVTPLAVDGRLRRAAVEATPASVDQPVDRHLLCVGGLGWHKNTDTLLRGLALHRDLWGSAATPRLVIVGRDYGAKADLRSNVEDLDLDSLVAFAGTVDFGELDSLYRTSLALVAVSHYEGFGFPVLEAMSYGIPVITTRGGAMAEVAGEAAWSVDGSDPRAIAAAIEFARSRGSAMQRKAELGRARASMYTWDRTADETVRVYESLLGDT
jgi:glycosyltransferase involved in cell wall biosynthesis